VDGLSYIRPQPGDKILAVVSGYCTDRELDFLKFELSERFPEVEWTIVAGISHIVHSAGHAESKAPQGATDSLPDHVVEVDRLT
jgi:hypothetical protein